jgi:hypothetical protein
VNGIRARVPYIVHLALVAAAFVSLEAMRRTRGGRGATAVWTGVMLAAIYVLAVVGTGRGTLFGDFDKAYYRAGELITTAPHVLYACGQPGGSCFVNVPIVAMAFVPVASLSLGAAHVLFTAIGVVAVALTVPLLFDLARTAGRARYVVATLVLLNGPLYNSLRLGNLTHVILLALVAALLALRARRTARAGVLLAFCALIKPPFLLFLPYLAVRPAWRRAAVMMGATLCVVMAASLWWFGLGLHQAWFAEFVGGTSSRPIGAYNAQSISGALIRLNTSAHIVDWSGVELGPTIRLAQLAITAAIAATVGVALWWAGPPQSEHDALVDHSMLLCLMLLVSPVSWTHYYCYLLIPLAMWISALAGGRAVGWNVPAVAVSALLVSLPVALKIPDHPILGPVVARLLLSHYVAGAVFILLGLVGERLRAAAGWRVAQPVSAG